LPSTYPPRQQLTILILDKQNSWPFQVGRVIGSTAAILQGGFEVIDGLQRMQIGVLTSAETMGLGGVVAVSGAVEGLHGAVVAVHGVRGLVESGGNILHMAKRDGGGGLSSQTREELLKSKISYEKLIAEHQNKLESYKNNPYAHDNQGLLKNAQTEATRQKIIQGRINALQQQINKQLGELEKINQLLRE